MNQKIQLSEEVKEHPHTFSFCLSHTLTPSHPHTLTEERRLFVGMLSRELTEEDVRQMFTQFGQVEDVSILRNAQGASKGVCVCEVWSEE